MTKITQEDLVRYLYKETSERKTVEITTALQTDYVLRESYNKLLATYQAMNEGKVSPRKEAVDYILKYAAKKQSQLHSL
ncbi:MAG: hypothetical protein JSS98_00190 [Bacteroidetes bacterium]|nr:hypothetical protein [Bacteroidota bacterium]